MKRIIVALLVSVCSFSALAQESNESFFAKSQKFDTDGTEIYSSNRELKRHKKFGSAIQMGGASGVLGINAELNLDSIATLVVGMGTGPRYGTFNIQGKYNFEALYLSPFVKAGYSRWFNAGVVNSTPTNSDILRQIYSEKDLRAGKFDANFAVASIGAEYNQLEGELSGVNFYGEVTMMVEVQKVKLLPAGAIGLIYFY
jgi:hypothetical protein